MVQNAWVYATQSRERFGVDKNERIMARSAAENQIHATPTSLYLEWDIS